MSLGSVERLTGAYHRKILKLLVQIGEHCETFSTNRVQNLRVENVEVDEIWRCSQKKERHKRPDEIGDYSIGDSHTFVGIERDTKLILPWRLGRRTAISTMPFVGKLRKALNPMHWFNSRATREPPSRYRGALSLGATSAACIARCALGFN